MKIVSKINIDRLGAALGRNPHHTSIMSSFAGLQCNQTILSGIRSVAVAVYVRSVGGGKQERAWVVIDVSEMNHAPAPRRAVQSCIDPRPRPRTPHSNIPHPHSHLFIKPICHC